MAYRTKAEVSAVEPLIRSSLALGYSARAVARAVGCSDTLVARIRDGFEWVQRGPVPLSARRRSRAQSKPVDDSTSARVQRALRHWEKNEDMEASDVAEMYDVDVERLREAWKQAHAKEGARWTRNQFR